MISKGIRFMVCLVAAGICLCGLPAQAQYGVIVIDDGFTFSPDPVNVVTGEAVYWYDDGSGPYAIISNTGAWQTFETPGGILFTEAGSYSYFDDAGDVGTVNVSVNVPPAASITAPVDQAVLSSPATFDFSADASDTDADGLSDVQFFVNSNLVADVFSAPFTTTVTNLPSGNYSLMAVAYDNVGAATTNQINITVSGSIPIFISLASPRIISGAFQFDVAGLTVGKTNIVETSVDPTLSVWVPLATNVASSSTMTFTNDIGASVGYFRLIQLP